MKPQAQAILAYLQRQCTWIVTDTPGWWHPETLPPWTCGTVFSRFLGHDGNIWRVEARAQRISELKNKHGHDIESRPCRQHGHNVYEYRWIGGPE